MTTLELKQYIFENNKIEFILEKIGCHNIKYHPLKEFYSCANYNGDNVGAINVKSNEYLNVINWTREKEFGDGSDIITLVQYNKNLSFVEAVKYLHKILGLEYKWQKNKKQEVKEEPLDFILSKHRNRNVVNVDDIHVLDDKLIDDYIPMLHIDFYKEGIMQWTRDKFGIAYSYKYKRVILPMRYWFTGELLGFNKRTTIENYTEFGVKKYLITPTYPKQINLYGLYENYESIQKAGYVCVYEAEKSVLKRDSLNDSTGVALSGHSISDEQISILIGLNVEIVIALDKDIPIEEVRHMADKFYGKRKVSYIYDKHDLLKEKDSPVDVGNKIYQFLFEHRVTYDENEHKLYEYSFKK